MEPQVRYCTTSDGVSIAYYAIGAGPAIVDLGPPPASHLLVEWEMPEIRAWYQRFARHRTFVRIDGRGSGLSEREITAYSANLLALDITAVVDALALDSFTLVGQMNGSLAAVTYAAQHPERLDALILWCAYTRGPEFFGDSGTKVLRDMIDRDWHMFTESAAHSRFGWTDGDHAHDFARLWRAATTPEVQKLLMDSLALEDVTPLLPAIKAPTLVLQREQRGADVSRRIAAGIADARLVLLDGVSGAPYLADADRVWRAVSEFIGIDVPPEATLAAAIGPGALRTIVFTDIEQNTALLQRMGDERWRELLREHEGITREQLAAHDGAEIKNTGDGIMASFGSATRALECVIALQRAFASWNEGRSDRAGPLRTRIGVNAGEPIAENDDLFGTAVTMAARIMAHAEGGEILVSDVVRQLVAGKGFLFADRGEAVLRGFDDPVRLYELRTPEIA